MTPQERIAKVLNDIDNVIEIAKSIAINEIYAYSQDRIFNDGKDKYNQQIGTYSDSYKKTRKKKGLQTSFVDLTNTTNLKQSITRSNASIFFKNDYGKKISGYNEKRFNRRIFAPSNEEKKIWYDTLNEELTKLWKS